MDAGATCPNSTFPVQMTNGSPCGTFTRLDRLAELGFSMLVLDSTIMFQRDGSVSSVVAIQSAKSQLNSSLESNINFRVDLLHLRVCCAVTD